MYPVKQIKPLIHPVQDLPKIWRAIWLEFITYGGSLRPQAFINMISSGVFSTQRHIWRDCISIVKCVIDVIFWGGSSGGLPQKSFGITGVKSCKITMEMHIYKARDCVYDNLGEELAICTMEWKGCFRHLLCV